MVSKPRNLSSDFCYHIYNRCVPELSEIFLSDYDHRRFLNTLLFYLYRNPLSFSQHQDLSKSPGFLDLRGLGNPRERRVKLLAYVIMPNHYHLLIRPVDPAEVSRFVSDVANSYVRYFNTRGGRTGPLFQGKFKSKEITDESSLLQVSRYIHLKSALIFKSEPRWKAK